MDILKQPGKKILVHCHEGKSRSVMVVSTYVAIIKGEPLLNILKEVMKARGVDSYREALYELAERTIAERKI
jgi:protein-tyrosine phosphatase